MGGFFDSLSFESVLIILGFAFQLGMFWYRFRSLEKKVEKIEGKMESMEGDMHALRNDVREDINALQSDVRTLRSDAKEDASSLRDDLREIRQALYIPVKEEAAARYHAQKAARSAKPRSKETKEPKVKH